MTALRPPVGPNEPVPAQPAVRPRRGADITNDAAAIKALDWTGYACQCTHHGAAGCGSRAKYWITIHALHRCNDAGLDPFGNRVEIRCPACVDKLRAEIKRKLEAANAHGRAACETCGAPLVAIGDVLREITLL